MYPDEYRDRGRGLREIRAGILSFIERHNNGVELVSRVTESAISEGRQRRAFYRAVIEFMVDNGPQRHRGVLFGSQGFTRGPTP